jgi:hypothetical protein
LLKSFNCRRHWEKLLTAIWQQEQVLFMWMNWCCSTIRRVFPHRLSNETSQRGSGLRFETILILLTFQTSLFIGVCITTNSSWMSFFSNQRRPIATSAAVSSLRSSRSWMKREVHIASNSASAIDEAVSSMRQLIERHKFFTLPNDTVSQRASVTCSRMQLLFEEKDGQN